MSEEINYSAIGARIRAARIEKGLTQEQVATAAGITPPYMSNVENGNSKLALPTLLRIANVLETTVDTLLYDVTPALVSKYDAEAKTLLEDCSAEERQFLLDLMKHAKEDLRKNLR